MAKAVLLAAAAALVSSSAVAQTTHQDWVSYSKDGRCWAATLPTSSSEGIGGREGPYLSITNYPAEGVRGSVAVVAGFDVTKGKAQLSVDGKDFEALPYGEAAFVASGSPEAALVAAMRSGRELKVAWSDADGNAAVDSYSLIGFTAAKAAVDAACR